MVLPIRRVVSVLSTEMWSASDAEYLAKLEALLVLAVCAWVSVCSQVAVGHYVRGFRQSDLEGCDRL